MGIQAEFLDTIPYLTGLGRSELESIRQYFFEKKAGRGETLLFEGEPAENIYFVVNGLVKVFKTSADGKEQILQIIRPGDSFNDVPVFGGDTSLASAEAMSDVVLYTLRKQDLQDIIRGHPRVALNVIQILSQRVRQMVSLVEDLSFRHVTGRVAKVLLEYAGDGAAEEPRLTQQEMAAMIGTAREMVGRSLKVLEEEGTIRMERNRVVIADLETLREVAGITQ
jgi:CRP-like cAMP-binding protein